MEELLNQLGWKVTLETAPLPDGRIKKAIRVHRCDSVHILAFKTEDTVLLLREFRPFYQEYIFMLPSGKVDKELAIEDAAQRELREETGFAAKFLQPYGTTNMHDGVDITNHLFIAKELYPSPLQQDACELIEVHEYSMDEAIEKVLHSNKVHSPSAVLLLRYAREFKK